MQTDKDKSDELNGGFYQRLLPDLPSTTLSEPLISGLVTRYDLPLHIYFKEGVAKAVQQFRQVIDRSYPNTRILFAVKSNPCRGAIRTAYHCGCGIDAVSEFELRASLEEEIAPTNIICNGNAKSDHYIRLAVESGALIAADSFDEVSRISVEALRTNRKSRILLRLSGMALDGLTVADQSTAASWTKFGEPISKAEEFFAFAEQKSSVEPVGISAHIGTQICDSNGYIRLGEALLSLAETLKTRSHRIEVIDFGGGYPLSYTSEEEWNSLTGRLRSQLGGGIAASDFVTFGDIPMGYGYLKGSTPTADDPYRGKAYWSPYPAEQMLEQLLHSYSDRLRALGEPMLLVEPGRSLFGRAGITIAKVIGTKITEGNLIVIADLGIVNHGTVLVSPDVYPFAVWPPREDDTSVEAFIAGRLCFTGDMISKVRIPLNRKPERGDMLIIGMTGAYCADHFASNSCGFPRPAKVALDETGDVEIWRKAEKFEDLFGEINCVSRVS